VAKVK